MMSHFGWVSGRVDNMSSMIRSSLLLTRIPDESAMEAMVPPVEIREIFIINVNKFR